MKTAPAAQRRAVAVLWGITVFVMLCAAWGYSIGKEMAMRDNLRDAAMVQGTD
ncbi:MAG: hypothetical protein MUF47_14545 [Porphyrobacter sp.]|jgi:hypothetical protein|nr:hypothetical protein [Porphyrobacter sp.]